MFIEPFLAQGGGVSQILQKPAHGRGVIFLRPGYARRAGGEGPLQIQRKQLPLIDQGLGQMGRDHAHTQAVTLAGQPRSPIGHHHPALVIQGPGVAFGQAARGVIHA